MTTSTTENEQTAQAAAVANEKQEPPKKANARAQKPRVAPSKGKSGKKATRRRRAPKRPRKPRWLRLRASARAVRPKKVLDLLKRSGGVTLAEIMKATGWQPHSVRGFISGTLGKKMGLKVESVKGEDGERTYSIAK